MAFDETLGQLLDGSQLPPLPPNATKDQQTTVINEVINILNNYSRDIVATGEESFLVDGTDPQIIKIPHNLGYAPRAYCYLNGATIKDSLGNIFPSVNIPLPTPLSFTESGGDILNVVELDYFTDATNLYLRIINPNGLTSSNSDIVSYELTRTAAN